MAKASINLCGYINGTPKLIPKKTGGVFLGGIKIKFQPNRKYKPMYIPAVCFDEELAIYIAEKYRQGMWIQIINSGISADSHPRASESSISVIIRDIEDEEIDPEIKERTQVQDEDEDYIAF